MTETLRERLIALIEPVLGRMGYELVELEYSAGRAHAVLRLFIDREAGVTLDDCAQVSREVSTVLDAILRCQRGDLAGFVWMNLHRRL